MDAKSLTDLVSFSPDGAKRTTLIETANLWSEVVCLGRGQETGPMADPDADALFLVAAGGVVIHIGRQRKRLKQWDVALAPPGVEVTIRNAQVDPSVVLVVTAPPPRPDPSREP